MRLVAAGEVVLGALLLFNLLLTFGLIRRLRQVQSGVSADPDGPTLPDIGTAVGGFRATVTTGAAVSSDDLARGSRLVGFFSLTCSPCQALKAALLTDPPAERFLAFVLYDEEPDLASAATTMAEELAAIADVAVVRTESAATRAFGIRAYPSLIRVEDGVITAAGHHRSDLATGPEQLTPA